MKLHIDDDKIKAAAAALHDASDWGDERPSLAVYEAAVAKWMENAIESILNEPDYFAYGANRILSYSAWENALAHAEYWNDHPLLLAGKA